MHKTTNIHGRHLKPAACLPREFTHQFHLPPTSLAGLCGNAVLVLPHFWQLWGFAVFCRDQGSGHWLHGAFNRQRVNGEGLRLTGVLRHFGILSSVGLLIR